MHESKTYRHMYRNDVPSKELKALFPSSGSLASGWEKQSDLWHLARSECHSADQMCKRSLCPEPWTASACRVILLPAWLGSGDSPAVSRSGCLCPGQHRATTALFPLVCLRCNENTQREEGSFTVDMLVFLKFLKGLFFQGEHMHGKASPVPAALSSQSKCAVSLMKWCQLSQGGRAGSFRIQWLCLANVNAISS